MIARDFETTQKKKRRVNKKKRNKNNVGCREWKKESSESEGGREGAREN